MRLGKNIEVIKTYHSSLESVLVTFSVTTINSLIKKQLKGERVFLSSVSLNIGSHWTGLPGLKLNIETKLALNL